MKYQEGRLVNLFLINIEARVIYFLKNKLEVNIDIICENNIIKLAKPFSNAVTKHPRTQYLEEKIKTYKPYWNKNLNRLQISRDVTRRKTEQTKAGYAGVKKTCCQIQKRNNM